MTFEVGDNLVVVILAMLAAIPGIVAAVYAAKANNATGRNHKAIANVADRVDGRMDEMLRLTRASGLAQGKLEGPDNAGPQPVEIVNAEPVPVRPVSGPQDGSLTG